MKYYKVEKETGIIRGVGFYTPKEHPQYDYVPYKEDIDIESEDFRWEDEDRDKLYEIKNGKASLRNIVKTPEQIKARQEKETVLRIREKYPNAEYILLAGSPEEKAEYQEFVDQVKSEIAVEALDGKANK